MPTWIFTMKHKQKLVTRKIRGLKKAAGVTRSDKIKNKIIQKQQIKWFDLMERRHIQGIYKKRRRLKNMRQIQKVERQHQKKKKKQWLMPPEEQESKLCISLDPEVIKEEAKKKKRRR